MRNSQLYPKLAVERCRMYLAQLCAANHLNPENEPSCQAQKDTLTCLLKGLNQDLEILERYIDTTQG